MYYEVRAQVPCLGDVDEERWDCKHWWQHSEEFRGIVCGRLNPASTMIMPSALGFGLFLTACAPRVLLTPTTSFDDGFIPATKRARWCSYNVECVHPSFGHCQGSLWYSTCSDRPRFRECPPHYDSGTFPSAPRGTLLTHVHLGHDGKQSRLRRAWTGLR
jgi:hypothetical protein